MSGQVRTARDGHLGWIIFDHPERRNAISVDMWRQIPAAAEELAQDDAVRVVILRGAGETAFVSGADISEFEQTRTGESSRDYDVDGAKAFIALGSLPKPVIAMIHGFCVGGGVGISLTADLRYSADDGVFAVPAARLGLGYAMDGLETLCNLVGYSAAKEIFFTAQRYRAEDALRLGLVNGVFPKADLEKQVREIAERIAANAPLTVRSVKQIVRELQREPSARDRKAVNAGLRACFESADYREGVRAFLEKRKPEFQGR